MPLNGCIASPLGGDDCGGVGSHMITTSSVLICFVLSSLSSSSLYLREGWEEIPYTMSGHISLACLLFGFFGMLEM